VRDVLRDPVRSSIGRFSSRIDIAVLVLVVVFGAFANAGLMVGPVSARLSALGDSLEKSVPLPLLGLVLVLVFSAAAVGLCWRWTRPACGSVDAVNAPTHQEGKSSAASRRRSCLWD
jgi:hypothetical protein